MGLFAAILVISFHFPAGADRTSLLLGAVYVLLPSLLPLASAFQGIKVDYAAHFGGALGGATLAIILLAIWRRDQAHPGLRGIALAVALIGLAAFAYSAIPAIRAYPAAMLSTALIPPTQVPQSDAAARAQSADLAARYPRDPRARLMHAHTLLAARDTAGAERELRAGLAEEETWRSLFKPELAAALRATLAFVLAKDRIDEAKAVARPVCESVTSGPSRDMLDKLKLCPP
jgi:hypothetical protein